MIAHLSYVVCDRCGTPAAVADDAQGARVLARRAGFERRNWNSRIKDVCPDCQHRTRRIEEKA